MTDDDGVLTPGETADFIVQLYNEEGWVDANAVIASLSTDNENVTIINSIATYGSLPNGEISSPVDSPFQIQLKVNVALGVSDFTIDVVAIGSGGYQYTNTLEVSLSVSLFQAGFPFDTNSEIKSSPLLKSRNLEYSFFKITLSLSTFLYSLYNCSLSERTSFFKRNKHVLGDNVH